MKLQTNPNQTENHAKRRPLSSILVPILAPILALILIIQFIASPLSAHAQANPSPAFFTLAHVDESQAPTIHLWLYGDGLNEALSSAQLEIVENEQPQSIIGDTVEENPIHLIVAIDPWQISEVDNNGQSNQSKIATILRTLVEKQAEEHVLVRLQDQVAAHTLSPSGEFQTIQAWTNEPNLLYNSVVLNQSESTTTNDQLTSLLSQSMATFAANDAHSDAQNNAQNSDQSVKRSAKSILLFANANSPIDVEQVATQALAQGIHIHVVNLSSAPAESPELQQLAELTQGNFVDESGLDAIWQSLINYHTQRHIAYLSESTAAREIVVSLQADGQPKLRQRYASDAPETSADTAPASNSKDAPKVSKTSSRSAPTADKAAAPTLEPTAVVTAVEAAAAVEATPTVAPATEPALAETPAQSVAEASQQANTATDNATASDTAPNTASAGSNSQAANSQAANSAGIAVTIPGTTLKVPRGALIATLPILLLLLAYLIYRETGERRANRPGQYQLQRQAGKKPTNTAELFMQAKNNSSPTSENSAPLRPLAEERAAQRSHRSPASPAPTQDQHEQRDGDHFEEHDYRRMPARPAAPTQRPAEMPTSQPKPAPQHEADDEDDDLATMVSLNFSDDEATFRLRDSVEQPIIGKLIRVSNNPNLPQQLPIYGLNPGLRQARHIHVGRHSKNNTVVINDKAISREHAVLIQKEGRIYLRDNASSAGTYLNWRRLQPGEELLLRHNDLIGFGEICYEFQVKGEDEATIANP